MKQGTLISFGILFLILVLPMVFAAENSFDDLIKEYLGEFYNETMIVFGIVVVILFLGLLWSWYNRDPEKRKEKKMEAAQNRAEDYLQGLSDNLDELKNHIADADLPAVKGLMQRIEQLESKEVAGYNQLFEEVEKLKQDLPEDQVEEIETVEREVEGHEETLQGTVEALVKEAEDIAEAAKTTSDDSEGRAKIRGMVQNLGKEATLAKRELTESHRLIKRLIAKVRREKKGDEPDEAKPSDEASEGDKTKEGSNVEGEVADFEKSVGDAAIKKELDEFKKDMNKLDSKIANGAVSNRLVKAKKLLEDVKKDSENQDALDSEKEFKQMLGLINGLSGDRFKFLKDNNLFLKSVLSDEDYKGGKPYYTQLNQISDRIKRLTIESTSRLGSKDKVNMWGMIIDGLDLYDDSEKFWEEVKSYLIGVIDK